MDYTIKIGGEAGQGIQTVGDTLAKVFARAGYHVFTHQDYESRVRGGHNFYQIRFSDGEAAASREKVDLLVAFDSESIARHAGELSSRGVILYDASTLKESFNQPFYFDVPFGGLASEHAGSKVMANSVALGAITGLLGTAGRPLFDLLNALLRETFLSKGEEIVAANIKAAAAGHTYAKDNCSSCSFPVAPIAKGRLLISGTEAIALGALASGCRFYAAYPMTPSTGVMNFLADMEMSHGIVVEQAEDEIAAINMALGASFAGVRAMTGTSGGGFALMVEGLSLAGMTETPVVIALGQRPGPATGLPTRTEQGDLQFALYAGHGEFPRFLFAPGNPEQALNLTNKAFELAEKYQVPALVLFDQYLADCCFTYESLDISKLTCTDYRLRGEALHELEAYKRHRCTENGVSVLAIPGESRHLVVTDSDEHDEDGHIIEDAGTRNAMVEKRLKRKLPAMAKEMAAPELIGPSDADVIIVGWGSTRGLMKEAIVALSDEQRISVLHFSEIYPFPAAEIMESCLKILRRAKKTICLEQNATGQFAKLLRAETGYEFTGMINRFDGRPFTVEALIEEIHAKLG